MPHFLHILNEESFLDQKSLSIISLFVTSLTPLQLVSVFGDELPKHIKEIGEVNKISRKVSGRPTSIKNMVSSYKRGSDTPSRSCLRGSGRKSTFLGYRGRGSYFHDRQQVGGRSAPKQLQTTEGQSVNKVNVHSVTLLQAVTLSRNLPRWREFTSDPWILQTVSGYHLEFETTPHQVNLPKFPKFTNRETALIESEIRKLISKGAVSL